MTEFDLLSKIRHMVSVGHKPIVIFDIDDTIIDCRYRKLAVFKSFCSNHDILSRFPNECKVIHAATLESIHYKVADCMKHLGINNDEFYRRLEVYWRQHYFTDYYSANDVPFPNSETYVTQCYEHGAHIVYLTGRAESEMRQGTLDMINQSQFPKLGDLVTLMMKPSGSLSDLAYKSQCLHDIASIGTVVASFENELPNLNKMAEFFSGAKMYWRKTCYAPNPPKPHPRIEIMPHFPDLA